MKNSYVIIIPIQQSEQNSFLSSKIQELGDWFHPYTGIWFLKSIHSEVDIKNQLAMNIGSNEKVIIVKTGNTAATINVSNEGLNNLKRFLNSKL